MEKIDENQNPSSCRMIPCSPEQLRTIAERLDQEAMKITQNGEHILYRLSEKITLFYTPTINNK